MDPLGYVCLLLIVVSIIALIVLKKKQDDVDVLETRAELALEERADEMPAQNGNQKTIYEYVQANAVRSCPGCDGENRYTDRFCVICGQDLTKEGA